MSRWENPWTMGEGSSARRLSVGFVTAYPDGHEPQVITVVRETRWPPSAMTAGTRRGWTVTTTIRCACGWEYVRERDHWTDPRKRMGGPDTSVAHTTHADHCMSVAGERPRRLELAGPRHSTTGVASY